MIRWHRAAERNRPYASRVSAAEREPPRSIPEVPVTRGRFLSVAVLPGADRAACHSPAVPGAGPSPGAAPVGALGARRGRGPGLPARPRRGRLPVARTAPPRARRHGRDLRNRAPGRSCRRAPAAGQRRALAAGPAARRQARAGVRARRRAAAPRRRRSSPRQRTIRLVPDARVPEHSTVDRPGGPAPRRPAGGAAPPRVGRLALAACARGDERGGRQPASAGVPPCRRRHPRLRGNAHPARGGRARA